MDIGECIFAPATTIIRVKESVYKELRKRAEAVGCSMGRVVENLIRESKERK